MSSYVDQRKKEQAEKVRKRMEEAAKSLAEAKKASEERKKQADAAAKKKFDSRFTTILYETYGRKQKEAESSTSSESSD